MKKITDKPISQPNSQTIVNIEVTSISYKLPSELTGSGALDEISRICRTHPQGKALAIFDENGKCVYSLTVEESIF